MCEAGHGHMDLLCLRWKWALDRVTWRSLIFGKCVNLATSCVKIVVSKINDYDSWHEETT